MKVGFIPGIVRVQVFSRELWFFALIRAVSVRRGPPGVGISGLIHSHYTWQLQLSACLLALTA